MIKLQFVEQLFNMEIVEPNMIKCKLAEEQFESDYYEMSKSIINKLYKDGPLSIPYKTSQRLYEDVNSDYWKEYINEKLSESTFDFNNYYYILANGIILEMIPKDNSVLFQEVKESYEKLAKDLEAINGDKIKETFDLDEFYQKILIECEESEANKFTNIISIEMDFRNSKYSLSAGIYVDKLYWFHTTKNLDEKNLVDFLSKINLEDEIKLANKFGESLFKDYDYDRSMGVMSKHLSLAELFSTMKQLGIEIEYNSERKSPEFGQVTELKSIDEGSIIGSRIIDSFNSFDTPFKALKRLVALEKSFKNSKISFEEILAFMTQEYFNINISVTSTSILAIRNRISKRKNDFNIIKKEVKELNENDI